MPDLRFQVETAVADEEQAAVRLRMSVVNTCASEQIEMIQLTVQLQIEPAHRRYTALEKCALADLFGEPQRWSSTVRPLFWATVNSQVAGFIGDTRFDLLLPSLRDSEVGAAKYLRALEGGEVPVILLFSGRVLYLNGSSLQMSPIPWSQETSCRIPAKLCQHLIAPLESRVPLSQE